MKFFCNCTKCFKKNKGKHLQNFFLNEKFFHLRSTQKANSSTCPRSHHIHILLAGALWARTHTNMEGGRHGLQGTRCHPLQMVSPLAHISRLCRAYVHSGQGALTMGNAVHVHPHVLLTDCSPIHTASDLGDSVATA